MSQYNVYSLLVPWFIPEIQRTSAWVVRASHINYIQDDLLKKNSFISSILNGKSDILK